jgi:hypothetical protein
MTANKYINLDYEDLTKIIKEMKPRQIKPQFNLFLIWIIIALSYSILCGFTAYFIYNIVGYT